MFKLSRKLHSIISAQAKTSNDFSLIIKKINSLNSNRAKPIKTNFFDKNTLLRIGKCSNEFLAELFTNLNDYGIEDKYVAKTLRFYDDWSELSRENISKSRELYRSCSYLKPDLFQYIFSSDKCLLQYDDKKLMNRINDLKEFFTKNQLNKILANTPSILSNNLDMIRYKFSYVFILMGIKQDEMCLTHMFDHSVYHIRERHLFLERSLLYDKPNKKGITKFENPRLNHILDSNLKDYLKKCTNNLMDEYDYMTFCEYLKLENFDNELLGNKMGRMFRDLLLHDLKESIQEKRYREKIEFENE